MTSRRVLSAKDDHKGCIDSETACPACRAAWAAAEPTVWPARGEPMPGDLELVRDLDLPRVPQTLDAHERGALLVQLLDVERTLRRYPDYGHAMRLILERIATGGAA